ncbi:hypothetical protein [Arcobacter ellisii]|uniref:Uncharacterized protein n=1 Tax=Arcobacter ellisii TaxID=913109 RepID=A0A347UA09_9BACT|nr:hypothetical protein [Arcobacter ellisii]AXX95687.1 hypothetical protein AELL_2042 [Arcobacter ellisii]RXI31440.1 hypothetical protein CP962_04835 [Arcobacter ellisii]
MIIYSPLNQQNFLEIEVTEKIKEKNLKKFINSSLKINNFDIKKSDKIFTTYIEELNIYQIFILENDYKYFEFQVFELFYKDEIKKSFDLYLCEDFFCLFKNGSFYYFQRFSLNLPIEEFIEFLNKKFSIKIENYRRFDNNDFEKLKNEYLKSDIKTSFKPINKKSNYEFYFYIFYLIILIILFYSFYLEKITIKNSEFVSNDFVSSKELKNKYQFSSFYENLDLLLKKIESENLDLISYEFKENSQKIVLISDSKENIYAFLEKNKNYLLSSSFNFLENKNLYEVVIYVKLSK